VSKSLKTILFAVGGFAGLLVLVAVALPLFVDANAHKPQLEKAASGALGMEVRVGGKLGIGFFPGLIVTLEDVHIRNREADVASAKEASLGIDFLPLFQKEVRIGRIALKHARISIERDRDGKFLEKPEAAGGTLPALDLLKVSISDGNLLYADKQSGERFEAGDCRLDVRRLQFSGGESPDFMKNLSFTAELACGQIRKNNFTVSDLKVSAGGKNGVFDLKPVTTRVFGAQGSGSIQADFSGAAPIYKVHYSLSQFRIEEYFQNPVAAEGRRRADGFRREPVDAGKDRERDEANNGRADFAERQEPYAQGQRSRSGVLPV
jgi:AsmA protein